MPADPSLDLDQPGSRVGSTSCCPDPVQDSVQVRLHTGWDSVDYRHGRRTKVPGILVSHQAPTLVFQTRESQLYLGQDCDRACQLGYKESDTMLRVGA